MAFTKCFPRERPATAWQEVVLTPQEEQQIEAVAYSQNIHLLERCLLDTLELVRTCGLREQGIVVDFSGLCQLSVALFEKSASHVVFFKERACKEKL